MPRVFVPPPQVHNFGETRGVTGATMEDGTVYKARRNTGAMDVDDRHLSFIKRDGRCAVETFAGTRHALPGRPCSNPTCHWRGWSWQETCVRCGAPTQEEEINAPASQEG